MNISSTDKSTEANEIQNHPDFQKVVSALNDDSLERDKERYEILVLFTKYQSISKVSQFLDIDRKTVRKWILRFQERGFEGLKDKKRSGRKSILMDDDIALIEKTIKEPQPEQLSEEQWNAKGIANYLHLPYHPVLRFLKAKGIDIEDFPYNRSENMSDQRHAATVNSKQDDELAKEQELNNKQEQEQ